MAPCHALPLADLSLGQTPLAPAIALLAAFAILCIILVGGIALITLRWRMKTDTRYGRRSKTKIIDAWAEAGRRAEPLPVDRVDLGDEDWDEPDDDEPWRESLDD